LSRSVYRPEYGGIILNNAPRRAMPILVITNDVLYRLS